MTREEAINELTEELMGINPNDLGREEMKRYAAAINMGIEALKEMSAEEYRQRLMEVFHRTDHDELLTYVVMPKEEEFKSLEYILRQYKFEPRQHGEWIPKAVHNCWTRFECSVCGYYHQPVHDFGESKPEFNFCPNCGADMREGDEK